MHFSGAGARAARLEVLAANNVQVMIAPNGEYTPTPAVSHAILKYNRGRKTGLADGIVVTPSHNPPEDGGFKYNPPHGGPADTSITAFVGTQANQFLKDGLTGVKRVLLEQALKADTTHRHDFIGEFVGDLGSVIDMDAIRDSKLKLGVDPLGGAGVHYWGPIGERYGLNLTVVRSGCGPYVPVYDAGLGWQNPNGSIVAVRDAAADWVEG